jgi:hypothetical protein
MLLTKGIFGEEFRFNGYNEFDLRTGQLRAKRLCHNVGWYNKLGEKLGWGDLDSADFEKIQKVIPENEWFLILSEQDSFWNFVTKLGIIGSMCETSQTEQSPGIEYVLDRFIYAIDKSGIYCREDAERYGFKPLSNEQMKSIRTAT